jgi:hypothetical protein
MVDSEFETSAQILRTGIKQAILGDPSPPCRQCSLHYELGRLDEMLASKDESEEER